MEHTANHPGPGPSPCVRQFGIPPAELTNEQWQYLFTDLKQQTIPSGSTKMKGGNSHIRISGIYSLPESGDTQYQRYKYYINDVLRQIRKGNIEYCYYIYQICDLLRYEHDTLKTRYEPAGRYFEVWL
ncbi:hypothetical protein [Diplocloster modestus]|uniref:Uncharacterized protein n=1 Tax=Diplocloster modestus TaxID=2850322 RepID=A0ABS6KEJ6_9FIRM|nr:hypothetical protein [Diplocloster modestus]MBU9728935.1 hypothetical protein [Diplocloster modestus]